VAKLGFETALVQLATIRFKMFSLCNHKTTASFSIILRVNIFNAIAFHILLFSKSQRLNARCEENHYAFSLFLVEKGFLNVRPMLQPSLSPLLFFRSRETALQKLDFLRTTKEIRSLV